MENEYETKEDGRWATLHEPYLGYSRVQLIEQTDYKWLVRLPSGYEMQIYSDEFEID